MTKPAFRALNKQQARRGQAAVREPAQFGGGLAAPARSRTSRRARALRFFAYAWGTMSEHAGGYAVRHARVAAEARASPPTR